METSHDIIEKVVNDFKSKFSGQPDTEKRRRYDKLKKPDICDTLISANETRHKWYLDIDNDVIEMNDDLTDGVMQQKNQLILEQQTLLAEREKEIKTKSELEKQSVRMQIETMKSNQYQQAERDKYMNEQVKHIEIYVKNFVDVYQRKPLREEITDNLSTQVPANILEIFFATYKTNDNL